MIAVIPFTSKVWFFLGLFFICYRVLWIHILLFVADSGTMSEQCSLSAAKSLDHGYSWTVS